MYTNIASSSDTPDFQILIIIYYDFHESIINILSWKSFLGFKNISFSTKD